jgi:drug/metabolite transporter (DMT)-like permease
MSGGTIYQKRYCAGVDLGTATLLQHVGATAFVGVVALLSETKPILWAPMLIGTWLWQTVVVSIGAVALLLAMLRDKGAARASAVFYLIPAASALLAWLLLGESLTPLQIIGTVLVTVAVVLIDRGARGELSSQS